MERLYVIFILYPYSRNIARSIRKEPKVYFYDCTAASNGEGARFENLVGVTLLKYTQLMNDSRGTRLGLHYFRDKDKHEVDFVVTNGLKAELLVEAKLNDDATHPGLSYLTKILPNAKAYQLVGGSALKEQHRGAISVLGMQDLKKLHAALVMFGSTPNT